MNTNRQENCREFSPFERQREEIFDLSKEKGALDLATQLLEKIVESGQLAKYREEIRKLNKAILRRNYQVERWKEKYYMEKQLLEDSMADATQARIDLGNAKAALRKSREQKHAIYNAHFNANPIIDDEEDK